MSLLNSTATALNLTIPALYALPHDPANPLSPDCFDAAGYIASWSASSANKLTLAAGIVILLINIFALPLLYWLGLFSRVRDGLTRGEKLRAWAVFGAIWALDLWAVVTVHLGVEHQFYCEVGLSSRRFLVDRC